MSTHRILPLRRVSSAGTMISIPQEMIDAAANRGLPAVSQTNGNTWMPPGFVPNLSVHPVPEERRYDYPVGINTRFTPKSGEGVTFGQLRLLADSYDLMRVIIERRKDQVEAFGWELKPLDGLEGFEDQIQQATKFLKRPSIEYDWGQWLRAALEDLLVCDAITIVPRHLNNGRLYSLDLIDPATIKRVIDDRGMMPLPPDPAYQQVIKGIPVVNFTSEELYYWIRNPRTWRLYGYSPVEWIIITVNIALQRQAFTLSYFSEGNIPEALAAVPDNWTTAQIKEFQLYWDDLMTGNMAQRRRLRFIPMDPSKVRELKQPDHKNEFEEWLARLTCFAFSISASALIKDMNRATADTNKEIAEREGLMPTLSFIKARIDYLLQHTMGFENIEFNWKTEGSLDAKAQAEVHAIYLDRKVVTPDEVRVDLNKKAMTPEEREAAFPKPPPMPTLQPGGVPNNQQVPEEPPPGNKKEPVPAEKLVSVTFSPTINIPERNVVVEVGDVNVTAEIPAA